jgi:hypothetical protein
MGGRTGALETTLQVVLQGGASSEIHSTAPYDLDSRVPGKPDLARENHLRCWWMSIFSCRRRFFGETPMMFSKGGLLLMYESTPPCIPYTEAIFILLHESTALHTFRIRMQSPSVGTVIPSNHGKAVPPWPTPDGETLFRRRLVLTPGRAFNPGVHHFS